MTTSFKKRPFGATLRTLSDISNSNYWDGQRESSHPKISSDGKSLKISVQHIPTLPNSDAANAILQRIHSEFHTIIERRGWNVISITEMCCCDDGLDHLPNRKKKRKTRVMPNNVLGYNLTTFHYGKSHSIHLRLRHPKTHALLPYEDIAGTMCHELAHCVVGPHNAQFYKAMEEIEEQYASFLVTGTVLDKAGFPIGSNDAHVLGTGGGRIGGSKNDGGLTARGSSSGVARGKAGAAAESRRKKGGLTTGQGYVLGGKSKKIDPKEAARIAAERRLLDSQYCLPCDEVIEILGDSSEEEEELDVKTVAKRPVRGGEEEKKEDSDKGVVEIEDSEGLAPSRSTTNSRTKKGNVKRGGQHDFDCIIVDANDSVGSFDGKPAASKKVVETEDTSLTISQKRRPTASKNKSDGTSSVGVVDLTNDTDALHSETEVQSTNNDKNQPQRTIMDASCYWECSCCTLINPKTISRCQACDTSNPTGIASDKAKCNNAQIVPAPNSLQGWSCPKCTFNNPPLILVCDACLSERPSEQLHGTDESHLVKGGAIQETDKKDIISEVKKNEVEESKKKFGGFNIYGDKKNPSSTMKHLT